MGFINNVQIVAGYPNISNLMARIGLLPNIKKWMETRPPNPKENAAAMICFKNAYKLLKENIV